MWFADLVIVVGFAALEDNMQPNLEILNVDRPRQIGHARAHREVNDPGRIVQIPLTVIDQFLLC